MCESNVSTLEIKNKVILTVKLIQLKWLIIIVIIIVVIVIIIFIIIIDNNNYSID